MVDFKNELSEIRTCYSIVGLSCTRILKKYAETGNPECKRYISILNEALTKLGSHIEQMESIIREEKDGNSFDEGDLPKE